MVLVLAAVLFARRRWSVTNRKPANPQFVEYSGQYSEYDAAGLLEGSDYDYVEEMTVT